MSAIDDQSVTRRAVPTVDPVEQALLMVLLNILCLLH
jgi:hypothetical protein